MRLHEATCGNCSNRYMQVYIHITGELCPECYMTQLDPRDTPFLKDIL